MIQRNVEYYLFTSEVCLMLILNSRRDTMVLILRFVGTIYFDKRSFSGLYLKL